MTADKTHRGYAIIEQVHADLKNSALAHLPSGKFTAKAAWLVLAVMAFNLTRAAGTMTGTHSPKPPPPRSAATRPRTSPDRVFSPATITAPAHRMALEDAWTTLFTGLCAPPPVATT